MPIDDLTALGQKMREARKKKDLKIGRASCRERV